MAHPTAQEAPRPAGPDRDKALKILAKSIFKELRSQGYEPKQIVGLATELIAQVTSDLGATATSAAPSERAPSSAE